MSRLIPGQHVHFVGIGGVGLSAIARILLEKGLRVSGSDRAQNGLTEALARDGATLYLGHDPRYVEGADLVIVTSAAAGDHVEVAAARERGIPVYKRSEIIADVLEGHYIIAVAGTHGKTTTTAMITHILREMGRDPSYIIGGILQSTGTNAGVGSGDAFVIEADEYDNMFHGLTPDIAVVTNVEWDHPDFFKTPHDLTKSFRKFVNLVRDGGLLIACADDEGACALAKRVWAHDRLTFDGRDATTYGIDNASAVWRAENIRVSADGITSFDILGLGDYLGTIALQIPGRHNILNTMAALLAVDACEADTVTIDHNSLGQAFSSISSFNGTGRRFELRGEIGGVYVIDDYAHHPTAIKATIEAAKSRYPDHELWVVWQPHTYSRTQALMADYLRAFDEADHVLVTDIYAAREQPILGVTSAGFVAQLEHPDARHTPSLDDAVNVLDANVKAPAVILIMSAGDAPKIGADFLRRRAEQR